MGGHRRVSRPGPGSVRAAELSPSAVRQGFELGLFVFGQGLWMTGEPAGDLADGSAGAMAVLWQA
jgi:hypothetical protein